jgi:hypothetical protein
MKKRDLEIKVFALETLIDKINERTVLEMQFDNHLQNNRKELFKAYYRERKRYFKKIGVVE